MYRLYQHEEWNIYGLQGKVATTETSQQSIRAEPVKKYSRNTLNA